MKNSILSFVSLASLASMSFSAHAQQEQTPPERVILNDILAEIAKPEMNTHIKILDKVGKFNLLPAESPTKDSDFKEFHNEQQKTVLFIPSSGRPFTHNQVPSKAEIEKPRLEIPLARNQRSFSIIGAVPSEELKDAKLAVSELKTSSGKVFPSECVKVLFVRHLMITSDQFVFRPCPFGLQPLDVPVGLHKDITYDFAIETRVPESISPGTYSGKIIFSSDKTSLEKEISVNVLDISLLRPDAEHMNWGFYCVLYGGEPRDYEFMSSYGINTMVFSAGLKDDFTKKIGELRKSGIDGKLVIDVGALDSGIQEAPYSKEWESRYKENVAAFDRMMRDAGEDGRYIGMIHDEPRETMLNAWNRTYDQMMIYHRLVGEAAPKMQRGVNPMSDGQVSEAHPDGLYADFAKCFEMIMPHYWAPCKNMIRLARENPKCSLWSYNDGDNRLAWGLHSWKVGLKGRTLYNYRTYGENEHPLSPVYMSSREFEGRSFTGNYVIAWKDKLWGTVTLMNMCEGINDYRYVYTLEQAIGKAPADRKTVADEARSYLEKLRKEIPEYAHSEKFTDGKETGSGEVNAEIARNLDSVRAKLAEYIVKLMR